jgi:peptidoglycan hydrolase CwlO-like protein
MDKEMLKQYQDLSDTISEKEETYKKKLNDFKVSIESEKDEIDSLKEDLTSCKDKLSEAAIKEFNETGEKKLLGGVGIKENKKVKYLESKAKEWAKEKNLFQIFDKKGFEKFAKDNLDQLDFVEIKKVPSATFPPKLKLEE